MTWDVWTVTGLVWLVAVTIALTVSVMTRHRWAIGALVVLTLPLAGVVWMLGRASGAPEDTPDSVDLEPTKTHTSDAEAREHTSADIPLGKDHADHATAHETNDDDSGDGGGSLADRVERYRRRTDRRRDD